MTSRKVRVFSWRGKLTAVSVAAWLSVFTPVTMAQTVVNGGGGVGGGGGSVSFPLLAPDGTNAAPSYSFADDTNNGIYSSANDEVTFANAGARRHAFTASAYILVNDTAFIQLGASADSGLERQAAGVVGAISAAGAAGWIQNEEGDQFLTANHTNATATPTDLTDLTTTVTTGRKYSCVLTLMQSQDVAADGVRVDFEGGTATATNFRANVTILDGTAYDTHTAVTALATDVTSTDIGTTVLTQAVIAFEPSGTGTFIPRVGLEAASTGTITTFRGSSLTCKDMP